LQQGIVSFRFTIVPKTCERLDAISVGASVGV
jgi:hypothetical protein